METKIKLNLNVLAMMIFILTVSCGVDQKPKYPDKNFGQDPQNQQFNEPEPIVIPDRVAPNSEPVEEASTAEEQENQDSADLGTTDAAGNDGEFKVTKIGNYILRGYFDVSSLELMSNKSSQGNGQLFKECSGNLNRYYCKEDSVWDWLFFNTKNCIKKKFCEKVRSEVSAMLGEPDEVVALDVFNSNQDGYNKVVRTINTATGDRLSAKNKRASQSGVEASDWNTSDSRCPYQCGCIDKTLFTPSYSPDAPDAGRSKTYCYFADRAGQDAVAIPGSPLPMYTKEEFETAVNFFGPYYVKQYDGDVDCRNIGENDVEENSQEVWIDVQVIDELIGPLKFHKNNRLDYHYAVQVDHHKNINKTEQWKAPYVDSLRLASSAKYFINSEKQVVVKATRKVQSKIELKALSWIEWALSKVLKKSVIEEFKSYLYIDGMQLDVVWEYCKNELSGEESHCVK